MKGMIPAALALLPAFAAAQKPNIVIILADDQGYGGVNCYPHSQRVVTPNIDRLAASGVRCMQGYTSGFVSSPTRAGLMTGKYQQSFGNYGLTAPEVGGVPLEEKMLSEYLSEAGYKTACIGKWHLGDYIRNHPNNRGFRTFFGFLNGMHDYWNPIAGASRDGYWDGLAFTLDNMEPVAQMEYSTYEYTRRAVDFIEKSAGGPFFLYLPYNAIHAPLQAPEELVGELADDPRKPVKADVVRAMTAALDRGVGQVMDALDRLGLRDNTIVFYLSDNGGVEYSDNWILRGMKGSFYEGGIRVPFIVSYPPAIKPGAEYIHPVMSIDIAPTVMSAAGLPHGGMHGADLMPYLSGADKSAPHEVLYWSMEKKSAAKVSSNIFAVRQGRWKLVSDPRQEKDCDLYDLDADPGERNGLKDRYPEKYRELFALYWKWIDPMPDDIYNNGNARLNGSDLMRLYKEKMKESGLKEGPPSMRPDSPFPNSRM